jgi:DNA-directed RNA polymerase subunit RPC12/RpoP
VSNRLDIINNIPRCSKCGTQLTSPVDIRDPRFKYECPYCNNPFPPLKVPLDPTVSVYSNEKLVTSTDRPCPGCGSLMEYYPELASFNCKNCNESFTKSFIDQDVSVPDHYRCPQCNTTVFKDERQAHNRLHETIIVQNNEINALKNDIRYGRQTVVASAGGGGGIGGNDGAIGGDTQIGGGGGYHPYRNHAKPTNWYTDYYGRPPHGS